MGQSYDVRCWSATSGNNSKFRIQSSERNNSRGFMSTRRFTPRMLIMLLMAGAIAIWSSSPRAQQPAIPSTGNGDWPSYAGDLASTHYSPLDQINPANFSKLEVAWRFKTDPLGPRPEYKLEGTPVMSKGVLYTTGGTRRTAFALDAATGEVIWTHSEREGARSAAAP